MTDITLGAGDAANQEKSHDLTHEIMTWSLRNRILKVLITYIIHYNINHEFKKTYLYPP